MKLIIALIKPHKLPDVKQELFKEEVYRMTVTTALGCGQQRGFPEVYRGVIDEVTLHKKVRLEIAVSDDFVDRTVQAIIRGARTENPAKPGEGSLGDGKIFILPLEDCIRIRTGERGQPAIGEIPPETVNPE